MNALVLILISLIPVVVYFWREHKMSTPSLQWPVLAKILGLRYEADPPRLSGDWSGRRVAFETAGGAVTATARLNPPTRLRVECAAAEVVKARAGIVVPDPVEAVDSGFRDKPLLARCSDKVAGPTVFDAALQQRLAQMTQVDFVGQGLSVVWTLPALRDPDAAEATLGALCAVADALEHFPQLPGSRPRA